MIEKSLLHQNKPERPDDLTDKAFKLSIFFKGLDGVFQILGGGLLLIIGPNHIHQFLVWLTQREWSRNPNDFLAQFLMNASQHFSSSTEQFAALYLLSHGFIKMIIIVSLWKRRLWSYPLAIIFFLIFLIYQLYRFSYSHSIWWIVLSILDVIVIYLTWVEYLRAKKRLKTNS